MSVLVPWLTCPRLAGRPITVGLRSVAFGKAAWNEREIFDTTALVGEAEMDQSTSLIGEKTRSTFIGNREALNGLCAKMGWG